MKTKLVKKFIKTIFFITATLILISLSGCKKQSERIYNEAYKEIEQGHYRIAADLLEKSADQEIDNNKKTNALLEAARLSRFEIQDYNRAIRINRKIILTSTDAKARIKAQESLSEIYLENIQDYESALREFLTLEPLITEKSDKDKIKLRISQSQFLSGNVIAAYENVDLASKANGEYQKNFLKLKAQILTNLKRFDEAIATYNELRILEPDFFKNENLYITTSFVYEEKEDYAAALKYLEKHENEVKDKTYLEVRNKRLKEKLINKPFYKGRRK